MTAGLFLVAALFLLIGLFVLSVILPRFKMFAVTAEEPVRMPVHMGWILLAAIVALNIFAYDVGFGIGLGVFGASVIAALLLSFPAEKRTAEAWFLAVTGIVACLLFGFRANEFVQAVNVVTALICAGLLILLRSVETVRWHGLWIVKMKLGFLARFVRRPFGIGTREVTQSTSAQNTMTIIKTVGITAVVLIFFSAILASADPIFESIVREVQEQVLGRTIISAILVVVLLLVTMVKMPAQWQKDVPQMRVLGFAEMFIPAMSLVLLFGLFLAIQAKYLFASHDVFQAFDITYSEYVRSGFTELLIAAFFGSLIAYALILKQHAINDAGAILKLKWVNGVLLLELLLLLASAAKRDWMYIEVYGLTRVRVIGIIFLLWLLGVIALIAALNFVRSMNEQHLIRGTAILSAIVVLILNGFNIDHRVAFSALPKDQLPDIVYMSRLSSDAVHPWMFAINDASMRYESLRNKRTFTEQEKQSLADSKIALSILDQQIARVRKVRPWQEWTLSAERAKTAMEENFNNVHLLATLFCLQSEIRNLQIAANLDLFEQERRRIDDYHSPFIFDTIGYVPESLSWMATEQRAYTEPASCEVPVSSTSSGT